MAVSGSSAGKELQIEWLSEKCVNEINLFILISLVLFVAFSDKHHEKMHTATHIKVQCRLHIETRILGLHKSSVTIITLRTC